VDRPIISRADALAQGLQRYFTGEPCYRGHVVERLASNKQCVECRAISGSRPWLHVDLLAYLARFYELTNAVSRDEAIAQGLLRYFTGKPCHQGHIAERIVSSYKCLECARIESVATRAADPEKARGKDRQWRETNPEKVRANLARYRDANRDLINARMRTRRTEPGPKRGAYLAQRRARRAARLDELRAVEKAYREANPERVRQKAREYYWKDPPKHRTATKRWKENNPEKFRTYLEKRKPKTKAYREANRDKLNKYYRQWQIENKDRVNANVNKRRALKKQSSGQYTADEAKAILVAQKHKCVYCGADLRKVKKHLDHILPLSRGGLNDKTNIQWLCAPCNLQKRDKDPIEWANELGKLL
jgi:5-methylcytosine-specific restriction endonuclease McrA